VKHLQASTAAHSSLCSIKLCRAEFKRGAAMGALGQQLICHKRNYTIGDLNNNCILFFITW